MKFIMIHHAIRGFNLSIKSRVARQHSRFTHKRAPRMSAALHVLSRSLIPSTRSNLKSQVNIKIIKSQLRKERSTSSHS